MSDAPHILLVDDDARLRGLLSRYLGEQGFRVTTAETAADARDKLRFMDFDLMVLDVMMPGETGLALTEDLRGDRAPATPILLLTARGAPEDVVAGFEAGADDYLGKPFDPRVLLVRLRAMLRRASPPPSPAGPLQLGEASFDPARAELVTPNNRVRLTGGGIGDG
jgi:two-component system phosphate regulon response regulator OmpR